MIKSVLKLFSLAFGNRAGNGKTFHPSQTCPECGSKLCAEAESENWLCPNPDCLAQVRRGLVHWCSPAAMDIEGGGEALAAQLVKSGLVRDVAELYSLKLKEVATLERVGEKSAKNFIDAVATSKSRGMWRVLFGLGILHVGAGAAKSLGRHFATLDHVFDAGAEQLMEAEDIGEVIAQSILHWWGDPVNRKLVERLRKAGVDFKSELYQPATGPRLASHRMSRFLFAFAASLATLCSVAAAETSFPTLPLGSTAPDFNLPGVDGRNWMLKDFADAKVLVVLFTCNHCPTAQYYEERIKQIVADYTNKGVALVAIMPNDPKSVRLDELGWTDLGDSFDEMKLRAQDRQYNFPYLYDGDTEVVSRSYGPVATPHAFVFDAERKLCYVGAIDDSERIQKVSKHYLRDALDALLAGKEPSVAKTKVVGCSVKWAGKEKQAQAYLDKLAAQPVSLTNADTAVLQALRKNDSGKLRLVNFWATWCAPCVAEFDEFVTIDRMYRHRDFEMVLVSINRPDEEKPVLEFLKKHQASNRNLLFASAEREPLINAFDPEWQGPVPYTLLINPDGKIIYREVGSIDSLAVKRAIVKALNERKPW